MLIRIDGFKWFSAIPAHADQSTEQIDNEWHIHAQVLYWSLTNPILLSPYYCHYYTTDRRAINVAWIWNAFVTSHLLFFVRPLISDCWHSNIIYSLFLLPLFFSITLPQLFVIIFSRTADASTKHAPSTLFQKLTRFIYVYIREKQNINSKFS